MSPKSGEVKIPRKITPCPIVEAIIELRFESDLPSEAVFGILYGKFIIDYDKKVESLPIIQIPEAIRNQDPKLRFQPHYRLRSSNYILQIGPKLVSLSSTKEYVGWNEFSKKFDTSISTISELGVIRHVSRVGLRYINIFDFDIFDKINLKLMMGDNPFKASQMTIRSTLKSGEVSSNLQVANESVIEVDKIPKKGSVIDIDTSIERNSGISLKEISNLLNIAHIEEKGIFFSLLKTEYLSSLNPEY